MKRSPLAVVRGRLPLLAGVVLACLVALIGPTSGLADPSFDYSTYHDGVMDLVNLYATGSAGSLTAAQRQQLLSMQSWAFAHPGSDEAAIESNLASAARVDAAVPQIPDILDAAETAAGGPGISGWEAADAEGVALASDLSSGPVVIGYSLGGGQDLELHLSCSIDGFGSGSCAAENADPTYSVWVKPMGQFLYNEPFSWAGPEDYCACTPGYGTKDYDGTRHWHDGYYYDEAWGPTSGTTDSPYAGTSGTGARPGTLYIPHHDGSLLPAELPSTTSYPQEIGAFDKLATLPLGGWAFWDTSNFDIGDACTYDYGASNYEACADWVTPASDFALQTTEPPKTVSSATLASDGGTVVAAPSPLACADSSTCYTQITGIIDSDTATKEWVEHVLDPSDFPDNPLVAAVPPAQTLGPSSSDLTTGTTSHQGEPVDTATGNFYCSAVDVSLPGIGVPFVFTRSYNSDDATSGRLGVGWTDNLDWSLSIGGGGDATVHAGTGQQIHFAADGGGFVPDPGVTATLTSISGGYELVTKDQLHYVFNSSGELTGESDRNGQGLTLTYTSGVLSSVTDSVGRTITFTTTSGHLTGISLPDSRSVSYGYTSGKLTSFTDLNGDTVSYGYDTNGLLNQITDQNSHTVIANVYDGSSGRVTEQTDGRGHHSYLSWDAGTQTSTYTDARGKEWTDVYVGNVLQSQTDPVGDTTHYAYDRNDNKIAVTNPRGNTTTFTYDDAGNMLTETAPAPLSYVQSWVYDSKNDVTSYTNGNGQTATYGYNTAGDLTSVTGPDPDGAGSETAPVTTYGRDATTGQLTSVTDPRGKETDYGYDSHGNLTSVTTPEGEQTTYGYDSGGRMTSKVEARGNVTGCSCASNYTWTYSYDDANHILSQTDPLSHETDWTYYPGGQLETVTDANSHTTTYAYDEDNNLSSVTAPGSVVTSYSYDDNNNQLTKEDANSHTTTYTYDDANRLASKELAGGQTWSYTYDEDGDLATMVDANGNATMTAGDGTTTYGYDALDRLSSIDYSGSATPDVTYSYDGDGDRTQMTDGGTVTYSYDNLDRLTGVTRSSNSFAYGYDANSNLTLETYPDSTSVSYGYTDDEQLHTAASNSNTTTYGYDAAGNLTSTAFPSGNGYTETDTYDHAGRLTEVDNHNGGTVLSNFAYTLDPVGNPTETVRTGDISSTTSYGYDSLDRLTSECLQASCPLSTDPKTSWTYDNVGNRLTQTTTAGTVTSTFNSDDRLTAVGSTSYSYDGNGNQTAAGSNSFSYDLANRLISATVGAATTSYGYDGDGNRLTSNDGTNTTNYLWDPASSTPQLDTESNGSGSTIRDYLYGNQLISMTTGGGSPSTYYYSYDGQGSVADLTDSSGTTEITYSYDAWGNPTATPISGAPTNRVQYTGGYTDLTGLVLLGAREYDPTTGRFLQTDPANQATGSTYAYTDDQPTAATDRTGLGSQGTFGVVVALPWASGSWVDALTAAIDPVTLGLAATGGVGYALAVAITPGGRAGSAGPQQYTDSQGPTITTPTPDASANVLQAKGGKQNVIPTAAEGVQTPEQLDQLVREGKITEAQRRQVEKSKGWRKSGFSGNRKKPKSK